MPLVKVAIQVTIKGYSSDYCIGLYSTKVSLESPLRSSGLVNMVPPSSPSNTGSGVILVLPSECLFLAAVPKTWESIFWLNSFRRV